MLPSFSQSQHWVYSEPLLFDDEFCQSLMKDLQALPTPPQSPPMKSGPGGGRPLSKEEQLSFVSDVLLEDHDMQLGWNCDFFPADRRPPREEEDGLWGCLGADRALEERLACSVLGSSPLLSDIDTSIFEEIAGSTLDCQAAPLQSPEPSEATSDYSSVAGELSNDSSSDSEEEIDVVTVVRCSSSPAPSLAALAARQQQQQQEEQQRALQRHHQEIHLQHNYAAPRPDSPPPPPASHKRLRGGDSSRLHPSTRSSSSSPLSSSCSRHPPPPAGEASEEEERRRSHNVMERQRRNELKNCFVRLRDNVPELSHNDKASKVVILKKARDGIRGLEDEGHRLQSQRERLRQRQERLKARLVQLRS